MEQAISSAPEAQSKAEYRIIGELFHLERREIGGRVDWLFYIDDCEPVRLTTADIMSSRAMLRKCFIQRGKWVEYRGRREHCEWMRSLLADMLARRAA